MWLVLVLAVAICRAQDDECLSVDPAINTLGKCYKTGGATGLTLGYYGFATYRYHSQNFLVNAHKTYNEIWNVDDPFDPELVENITGLDQCRGFVYANPKKIGNYVAHFGNPASYCNCLQDKPCIPFLNYTNGGVVKTLKICDNAVYPVKTKDVSAPGKLSEPLNGCNNITNDLTGKVAVIQRGACAFQDKVDNAVARGAVAVVIVNGIATAGTGECFEPGVAPVNTPTVMISYDDGLPLTTALANGDAVTLSLGPTYFLKYNVAQADAPFGGVWGTSQYVHVAHFSADTAADYISYKNANYPTLYNPYSVIGLSKRPDAESTEYFIVASQTQAAVARIEDGEFSLVTNTFDVPNILDFGISVFYVRGGRYWLATPNYLGGTANIFGLAFQKGGAAVLELLSSIPAPANQVVLPIPPLNRFLYANSAAFDEAAICPRRYDIYNITYQVSPTLVKSFQTHIKADGGTDQSNDGDFLEAYDGTIVGAVCGASEGILLYNANNPANPVLAGVYDSSVAEGDYQTGATLCVSGTDGLTWWYQQTHDQGICAVQLAYGPGSANSGSAIVLNVFVGLIAGFLAMQW